MDLLGLLGTFGTPGLLGFLGLLGILCVPSLPALLHFNVYKKTLHLCQPEVVQIERTLALDDRQHEKSGSPVVENFCTTALWPRCPNSPGLLGPSKSSRVI